MTGEDKTVAELTAMIDDCMKQADERFAAAAATSRTLYPFVTDWATADELDALAHLQARFATHPYRDTLEKIRARVAAKRAARLAARETAE